MSQGHEGSYRTVLLRDKKSDEVIKKIAGKYGIKEIEEIMHRWKRSSMRFREVVAYVLTTFYGLGAKKACLYMNNITGTCLSRLSEKGFRLFVNDQELQTVLLY